MWVAMWVEIKNTPKGALNIGTWRRRSPTSISPLNIFKVKNTN